MGGVGWEECRVGGRYVWFGKKGGRSREGGGDKVGV